MKEMDDFLGSEIRIDPYLLKREDAQRRSYLKKSTYLSRSFKRRKPLFPDLMALRRQIQRLQQISEVGRTPNDKS